MPLCHFQPETCPPLLTLWNEKIEAFAQTELDHLFIVPFDDSIAHKTYGDFMRLWTETIGLKLFVGGPDFALGARREGTIPQLQIWAKNSALKRARWTKNSSRRARQFRRRVAANWFVSAR
jgi:FAD synthase